MLHPAPTNKIDPTLARGIILEVLAATDRTPPYVVMGFPNTSYRLMLETSGDEGLLAGHVGDMVLGRIFAKAMRVDETHAGGRSFDPCLGRPTRVMGTVVAIDPTANVLVVDAGAPIALSLTAPGQHATTFSDAEFIVCNIKPGAAFKFAREA
ncbi:MAG: hypothetical protein WD114_06920 [Phycisphaerales bacterium]